MQMIKKKQEKKELNLDFSYKTQEEIHLIK